MDRALRVLHLEDDAGDAGLVRDVLELGGIACDITRVQTREDFVASLEKGGLDLIFADYSLPSFDGMSALKIAAQRSPDVPFIFVSGMLGEEVAIEALKLGATDYVLKERLSRIVSVVPRALREAQHRADRKQADEALRASEERFRTLVLFSFDVYWETDAQHRFIRQDFADSPAPGSEIGKTRWEVPYLEPDEEAWRKHRATLDAHLPFRDFELARPTPDGGKRYFSISGLPAFDEAGRFIGYRGVVHDITERKLAEEERRAHLRFLESMDRINRAMQGTNDLERMMSEVLDAVLDDLRLRSSVAHLPMRPARSVLAHGHGAHAAAVPWRIGPQRRSADRYRQGRRLRVRAGIQRPGAARARHSREAPRDPVADRNGGSSQGRSALSLRLAPVLVRTGSGRSRRSACSRRSARGWPTRSPASLMFRSLQRKRAQARSGAAHRPRRVVGTRLSHQPGVALGRGPPHVRRASRSTCRTGTSAG